RFTGGALAADRTRRATPGVPAGLRAPRAQIRRLPAAQSAGAGADAAGRRPGADRGGGDRAASGRPVPAGGAGAGTGFGAAGRLLSLGILLRQQPATGLPRLVLSRRTGGAGPRGGGESAGAHRD